MKESMLRFYRSDLGRAVFFIVGVKGLLFFAAALGYVLSGSEKVGVNHPADLFTSIWVRWDALHYIRIAEMGYAPVLGKPIMINFMPLFPWMIRLLAPVIGSASLAALLIANALSFAGLLGFYKLAELEFGKDEAFFALVAISIFPSAFSFNAPYTEGPFLFFAVGAFLAARKDRWAIAGFLGACAALTRYMGVFLFPALALEFYLQRREAKKGWFSAAWLLLIPTGFSVYLFLNQQLYGNPWVFLKFQQSFFMRSVAYPWTGIENEICALRNFTLSDYNVMVVLSEFLAAVFFVVGSVWAFKSLRLSYAVFVAGAALISLSNTFLLGTPRYLLSAFPLFFLLGRAGHIKRVGLALVTLSAILLAACAGRFVQGWWAF